MRFAVNASMDKLTIYDVEGESHLVELVNGTPVLHLKELREVPVFPFSMRVINSFNDSYFLLEGRYHREDGPAIESADGDKSWYVNGQFIIESAYPKLVEEFLTNG